LPTAFIALIRLSGAAWRHFLDELNAQLPIHSFPEYTAEILGRVGAEAAATGNALPLADLIIAPAPLN